MDAIIKSAAAQNLVGKELSDGWIVKEKKTKKDTDTGSFFSVCYIAERGTEKCFVKAFDFSRFASQGDDLIESLSRMTSAYKYERDLSSHCRAHHTSNVALAIGAGQINGATIEETVPYLLFNLADGDIRHKISFSEGLDLAYKFHSLHDVAVAISQLHTAGVSHQDIKPSNVLDFAGDHKLGDIGRSLSQDLKGPHSSLPFSGDRHYCPPEIMYRYYEADWRKRNFATDCYLFGNLVVFYFSGLNMSTLLNNHLINDAHWRNGITYEEAKPYLISAFNYALQEFKKNIKDEEFAAELVEIVHQLCYPLPDQRCYSKNVAQKYADNYSMLPFVTKFDVLEKRARLKFKKSWQ